MIVMAIIAVLLPVALPIYNRSIIRANESVLKNNLRQISLAAWTRTLGGIEGFA